MLFRRRNQLRISPALYQRLVAAAARAGYSGAEEMATHALEQAVEKIEARSEGSAEEALVDRQLRGLGYLE